MAITATIVNGIYAIEAVLNNGARWQFGSVEEARDYLWSRGITRITVDPNMAIDIERGDV